MKVRLVNSEKSGINFKMNLWLGIDHLGLKEKAKMNSDKYEVT